MPENQYEESTPAQAATRGRPSVCRNCGAIVAAGETACPQCGEALRKISPAAAVSPDSARRAPSLRDREAIRFARALVERPATFTFVFLIANLLVFLLMTFSGGSESAAVLRAYGAKYNSLIDNQKEWWRFVTPIFIHIGWIHLLVNMYSLWIIGPIVERLYGSAKFVVFWMVSGVAGVVASYLTVRPGMDDASFLGSFFFRSSDGPSAGASGALFGLIGVLFVFGLRFRHELPDDFKRAFGAGMLPTILLNLFIGYVFPFIDNAAHVGGLAMGAALALVVGYKRIGPRGRVTFFWHALQAAALALIVVSFAMVARHYDGPPLSLRRDANGTLIMTETQKVLAFMSATKGGEQVFVRAFNQGDTKDVPAAIAALDRAPQLDAQADELRDNLKSLILRADQLSGEPSAPEALNAVSARRAEQADLKLSYDAWQERFRLWIETNGKNYGLQTVPNEK